MRIAVIGVGPRALRALGALWESWPAGRGLEVHCFDPNSPGEGTAFDRSQPRHLLLNTNPTSIRLPTMPPLDAWLRQEGLDPLGDVPRAVVGRYLARVFTQLVATRPAGTQLEHHRSTVRHVTRVQHGWLVESDTSLLVDEVLLATGHAPNHEDELVHTWDPDQPTRLVGRVYPVTRWLTEEVVPPGSVVATRGSGLTFTDIALTLFEGRDPDRRPARILPTSPSGMVHHARPATSWAMHPDDTALLAQVAEDLPADPAGVVEAIARAAIDLLVLNGSTPDSAEHTVRHTLATGREPDLVNLPNAAQAALDRSISVAELAEAPGAAWMLARAWTDLHPTVYRRLSFSDGEPADFAEFLRVRHLLDKFAYGPPLPNAIRLSHMIQRKEIDLDWLRREVSITDRVHGLRPDERQPDVVIDAVCSPPGARRARNGLVDDLLARDLVSLAPGRRGLRVDRHAACLDGEGRPVPGLSAIGLLTEDVVIGNDTLGDAGHQQSTEWARRVVADASAD